MKSLTILGSTGSIGTQTLEIVERNPDKFKVEALCANSNWELLREQALKFRVKKVALADEKAAEILAQKLVELDIEVLSGPEGVKEIAGIKTDMSIVALVGISGLEPTLEALDSVKRVALANKETLVVGGEIVMKKAAEKNIPIIPIDSEHSAIFQCLNGENPKNIKRIILTSSGGPFRNTPKEELKDKKAADALKHPNWEMGKKVTIDSSTLMNKGFELIEARWLFDVPADKIDVIIHHQSVIHSMVEFIDNSIIAQLSIPDMRIPIQYAMTYPERLDAEFVETDFVKIGSLTFQEPRLDAFPCLQYAIDAIKTGGTMPAVLNGANEVAVALFLEGKIGFMDIPKTIKKAMDNHKVKQNPTLKDLLEADKYARSAIGDR